MTKIKTATHATIHKDAKPRVPRYYPPGVIKYKPKKIGIPKVAAWGWNEYHISIKILIVSVFLSFVCLTTPFWAYVDDATFGLWLYCREDWCSSIHDNLVEGRGVPAWYHMTQGSYCIGAVANLFGLGILVHNCCGGCQLKMSPTVRRMAICVLGISVFQQCCAFYTFITYFEHTDFLYARSEYWNVELDFHGSYYCGIVAVCMTGVAALTVILDDELTSCRKGEKVLNISRSTGSLYSGSPGIMYPTTAGMPFPGSPGSMYTGPFSASQYESQSPPDYSDLLENTDMTVRFRPYTHEKPPEYSE